MDISFGAIIFSIIIGVSSNLLTPYASKFLGKVSESVHKRNDEKKRTFEKTVQFIMNNPQEETTLRIRYLQRSLVSLLVMLAAFFFMISSNPLQILFGFIIFMVANYGSTKASRLGKILEEVWKRRKTKFKGIDLD
jgi:hypothetical protein